MKINSLTPVSPCSNNLNLFPTRRLLDLELGQLQAGKLLLKWNEKDLDESTISLVCEISLFCCRRMTYHDSLIYDDG
jgi:hypothetical protein